MGIFELVTKIKFELGIVFFYFLIYSMEKGCEKMQKFVKIAKLNTEKRLKAIFAFFCNQLNIYHFCTNSFMD